MKDNWGNIDPTIETKKTSSDRESSVYHPTPSSDKAPVFTQFILDTGRIYEKVLDYFPHKGTDGYINKQKRLSEYLAKYFCEAFQKVLRKEFGLDDK